MTRPNTTVLHLQRGFSLIELMVAILLGILVSIGLVSLFGTTSSTNKVQNALALLQENGRYAATRLTGDLRLAGAPYCSNSGGLSFNTAANGVMDNPVNTSVSLSATAAKFSVPDIGSTDQTAGWPNNPATFTFYSSLNIQGYECDKGGSTCSPDPSGFAPAFPAVGTTAGTRVKGTDVLTVRYLQNDGWGATSVGGNVVQATLLAGDPPFNFQPGDLILIGACNSSQVFDATYSVSGSGAGSTLTATLGGAVTQPTAGARVFNFTRDFVTVTYFVRYDADPNPDAANRVIPVLVRRVNGGQANAGTIGGSDQVIAQGVEQLDFLYGVVDKNGATRFLTADQVDTGAGMSCAGIGGTGGFAPGVTQGSSCLWAQVKSIEMHMLVNTVNDVFAIGANETPYCYSIDPASSRATVDCSTTANYITPTATSFNSHPGRMLRREFVSLVSVRNTVL